MDGPVSTARSKEGAKGGRVRGNKIAGATFRLVPLVIYTCSVEGELGKCARSANEEPGTASTLSPLFYHPVSRMSPSVFAARTYRYA